jgi:hypothetical protein
VRSSGVSGLDSGLGLLSLLLLLLDSGSVSEGVGNGSLVGLVESVVSVLRGVLVRLSGLGGSCVMGERSRKGREKKSEEECGKDM